MLRSRREVRDLETARQVVAAAERDALERAEQLRREAEELLEAARAQPHPAPAAREADAAGRTEEVVAVVAGATKEAEDLIQEALAAIERQIAVARSDRAKAARDAKAAAAARKEAESLLVRAQACADTAVAEARARAERIVKEAQARARAESEAELERARQRFAEETSGLRAAMDQTWSTLEKLVSVSPPQG